MQSGPFAQIPARKLGGHVLRLGSASAVAAPENLFARPQRTGDGVDDRFDLGAIPRIVEESATVREQLVEAALTVIVGSDFTHEWGSIQKRSSPCETSSPLPGTMRRIVPA